MVAADLKQVSFEVGTLTERKSCALSTQFCKKQILFLFKSLPFQWFTFPCYIGSVNKNAWRLQKCCSHHINDIDNCCVSFPISPIQFNKFRDFNQPFFPVNMRDSLQNALSKTCQDEWKRRERFSLLFLPGNNDIYIHSFILSSWENGIPLNK